MIKRKVITPEMEREIIHKHFKKGISQSQLAKEYGVSRETIHKYYCKPYGNSPLMKDYNLDDAEIIRLYTEEKKSVNQIAEILNITTRPITHRLRRNGVIKKVSKRSIWAKEIPHYNLKMKIWVSKIIEADNMLCKVCGAENAYNNRLEANHIVPVRDIEDPALLFDINNGITLCRKCHLKIHFHEKEYEIEFRNLIKARGSV